MRTSLFAAVILPLVFLVIVGCTKKSAEGSAGHARSGRTAAAMVSPTPGTAGAPGSVVLKPVGRSDAGSSSTTKPAVTAGGNGATQGTDRLLASRGGSPVFPSDYEIGALQPQLPAGTERGAIVRVVQEFFRELSGGKIDVKLISPQWKNEIVRLLSEPIKKGELPANVRIGIVSVEQDSAHTAIRMETETGSAVGEIYLDRVESAWYISDIQANFADLEKPASKGAPFDPAEWKSMIKE